MPLSPSFAGMVAEGLGDGDLLFVADVQSAEEDHSALLERCRGCSAASRPLSSVSRSVLISLPIRGVRSTTSSCAEVSPMANQLTLVRMVLAECFTRGCFHSSTASETVISE